MDVPPLSWLEQFRLPLLAAVIPSSLAAHLPLPPGPQHQFMRHLHRRLAADLAERLRRREVYVAEATASLEPQTSAPRVVPEGLPAERRLSLVELGRLESQRRSAMTTSSSSLGLSSEAAEVGHLSRDVAPHSGEARRRWLRTRLEQLLRDDTVPCADSAAV